MPSLSSRHRQTEWMDEEGADPAQIRKSLAFIERVNRLFGYARATIGHLDRLTQSRPANQPLHLLDLATGSADIPRAILKWADAKRLDVRVVAVDRQAPTIQTAREWNPDTRLKLVQADVFDLPFDPGSFDYVTANMFFHHLSEDQVVTLMRSMSRLARRGVIIADLLRHYRAYAWAWFFTLASNPMVRHDARASIRQAFTKPEILTLRDRAGLDFVRYYRHFGHRFVLAGQKPDR